MGQGGLIKPLHGLRGLAALSVVLHHLAPMKFSGAIGVTLFFVLSGYLMGRIYLEKPFGPREVGATAPPASRASTRCSPACSWRLSC